VTLLSVVDHDLADDLAVAQGGQGAVEVVQLQPLGARLAAATSQAGGLGMVAAATLSLDELRSAIKAVQERTARPFGVNLRADAPDAAERVEMIIAAGVPVASLALAPAWPGRPGPAWPGRPGPPPRSAGYPG
jgi:NAD(P)H-dependent flavin oxidoreductase YrpB (nitropropane dioxygenase family)